MVRLPAPHLRPFIKTLWAIDPRPGAPRMSREHVLPTGAAHIAFRLDDVPLRVFDGPESSSSRTFGYAVVGGVRPHFYTRDVATPVASVGAQLHPGATQLLFGVPADELAERHTLLFDLWGRAADEARARIAEAPTLETKLDALEAVLAARLPRVRGVHPAVADALARLADDDATEVAALVARSGYSHRFFLTLFREAVGLGPKVFARIARFQRAVDALSSGRASGAEVAARLGYADQAHFHRDFVAFSGVAPGRYVALAPSSPNHVPVRAPDFRSVQDATR